MFMKRVPEANTAKCVNSESEDNLNFKPGRHFALQKEATQFANDEAN